MYKYTFGNATAMASSNTDQKVKYKGGGGGGDVSSKKLPSRTPFPAPFVLI